MKILLATSARLGLVLLLTLCLAQTGFAQIGEAPVPSPEQQQTTAKLLNEALGVNKAVTPMQKKQLANDLMQKTAKDPTLPKEDLYVILTKAISLTQELHDLPAMNAAVEQLINEFSVEPFAERTRHLVRYLETSNAKAASAVKPILDEVVILTNTAANEHRYSDAESLLDQVAAALKKLNVPGQIKPSLTDLREEITAKKEKFNRYQDALKLLELMPDQPAANEIVGRWLVVEESDWEQALPHLGKASKTHPWQPAIALELTPDTDPLKIGDAWWEIALTESDPAKRELMLRAGHWYAIAQPNLATGLKKQLVAKHLDEIALLRGAAPNKPAAQVNPGRIVGKNSSPFQQRISRNSETLIAAGGTVGTERAVGTAMNWLSRHQNADGSWGCKECVRQCKDPSCSAHIGKGALDYPMAATAFGMLPFFAAGKTHESSGPYQKVIRKGLIWMTRNQNQKTGQLGGGNMYEHGLATIALCEAYGVSKDQKLKNAAMAAVKFIEFAQNETSGGWHYTARPRTLGDTSVLGWQFMGLKSAQMAGLPVNKTTLNNAKKFLASVSKGKSGGLFSYMPQSQPSPSMSAVGLLSNQYSGLKRTDPAMTEGMNYLMANLKAAESDSYFLYYATQVMHNLPGQEWETWNRQTQTMLVDSQIKEGCAAGSWKPIGPTNTAGPVMSTSIHALTLEIYYRYLPLYSADKGAAKAE